MPQTSMDELLYYVPVICQLPALITPIYIGRISRFSISKCCLL